MSIYPAAPNLNYAVNCPKCGTFTYSRDVLKQWHFATAENPETADYCQLWVVAFVKCPQCGDIFETQRWTWYPVDLAEWFVDAQRGAKR